MSGLVDASGRTLTTDVHVFVLGTHVTLSPISREQIEQYQMQACAAGHAANVHEMATVAFASQHLENHDEELQRLHQRCSRLERILEVMLDDCDDLHDLRSRLPDEDRDVDDELMPRPLKKPDVEAIVARVKGGGASA